MGFPANSVSLWTPSLPGHVVVSAYDPVEKTAYMLDSLTNVMAMVPSAGKGFFEQVVGWTAGQRADYFQPAGGKIVLAPFLFRYFDPGIWLQEGGTLTLEQLNRLIYSQREEKWRRSLTVELPIMIEHWRTDYPGGFAKSLDDYPLVATRNFGSRHPLSSEQLYAKVGLTR